MEQRVILKPLQHRGNECLGIYFDYNILLQQQVKQAGATWRQSNKTWYMLLSKANYLKIKTVLVGHAIVDYSALKIYLEEKKNAGIKNTSAHLPVLVKNPTVIVSPKPVNNRQGNGKRQIHSVNAHVIPAMEQYLRLKAYSKSTLNTYLGEIKQLLLALKDIPADDLTADHIKKYMVFCLEKLKLTENTLHSRINALKFYYEQVLKKEKFFWDIPRPKKPMQLPRLLNETELTRLFNALSNKKHKAMLFTELLPAKYYHVVFTLPHELNSIVMGHRKPLFKLLFDASAQTLLCFAKDNKYLGATPGIISVLHTWGQQLSFHPHIHCIVSGGGLTDDNGWKEATKNEWRFLFPVKAMSVVYKTKFLQALKLMIDKGEVTLPGISRCKTTVESALSKGLDRLCQSAFWRTSCCY